MIEFVDPRANPKPPAQRSVPLVAESLDEVEDLHRLCGEGRIYDIETWIKAGRPVQLAPEARPRGRRISTALQIALEAGQQSLLLLLLCNGYRLDLEPVCPLTRALAARRWDYVDLFWRWGADPRRVSADTIFDTYNSALFDRFHTAGVDFLAHHALADALGNHTSNKPLFGWTRRHRESDPRIQVELNMALRHHADQGNLKGVHLCLWAGADAHAPTRDLPSGYRRRAAGDGEDYDEEEGWTAVQEAVAGGHVELLPVLKPDPTRDDFEDLYRWARDSRTVEALAAIAPPGNVGPVIQNHLLFLDSRMPGLAHYRGATRALEALFRVGGRWVETTVDEIKAIRHGLKKAYDSEFVEVLKLLAQDDYCSPEILRELGRSASLRERMIKVGLLQSPRVRKVSSTEDPPCIPGARNILVKFGIPVPEKNRPTKGERLVPPLVTVGRPHWNGTILRLDRQSFYERVWAEPVDALAKSWGLSGRGLAKICERVGVPVPPRGYWARVQHGQHPRRTPLREVPHPAEVLIRLPPQPS